VSHPTDAVLEARGLTKRYRRGVLALAGIDLELPAGGITALVGPNAAGKSTLIKTWVGFEKPTRGSVSVMGIDPWRDRSRALAKVGYVPQSPALYDGLSVDDHLDLAAQLRPGFDRAYAQQRLAQLDIPTGRGARSLVRRPAGPGRVGPGARHARTDPVSRDSCPSSMPSSRACNPVALDRDVTGLHSTGVEHR
jgi:ABC-type glutathione transport system ATPase component